ncbi:MAG: isopentenyl-diphosphate Delta-isomerase [Bacteroidales bacterium]|jgi:isopentenyl-diphosphate Delta-isomerase|nr:isopentenyl-diphosphate Delta-isomerase [Bacteroidales bacterium]MDG2081640.1 isopentenyl-diphosphate Delta-isomerase [Bacteroidales bacterium]
MMIDEYVILVDKDDNPLGTMEKMEAHMNASLHRAFSVFIFNSDGDLLLQQRASHKYHSPLLWTNTVCSHPREGEKTIDAAHRRIAEEMGMDCEFQEVFSFIYKADVGQGLIEHELDHVFIGVSDNKPVINREEVESCKYVNLSWLISDIEDNPKEYTEWFKIAIDEVLGHFKKKNKEI